MQLRFKQNCMPLYCKIDPNVSFSFLITVSFQIRVKPQILSCPLALKPFINKLKLETFNHHSCIFTVIQKLFGDLRWLRVASKIELIKFLSGREQQLLLTWWGKSTQLLTEKHWRTLYVCLRETFRFCMFAFINVMWDNIFLRIRWALAAEISPVWN